MLGVGRGRGGRGTVGAARQGRAEHDERALDSWLTCGARARARWIGSFVWWAVRVGAKRGWAEAARWKWMSVASFVRIYDIYNKILNMD